MLTFLSTPAPNFGNLPTPLNMLAQILHSEKFESADMTILTPNCNQKPPI